MFPIGKKSKPSEREHFANDQAVEEGADPQEWKEDKTYGIFSQAHMACFWKLTHQNEPELGTTVQMLQFIYGVLKKVFFFSEFLLLYK